MKCKRDKFLVWFLESCPVRKGTLTKLKFGDLKPLNDKDVPFWLRVEAKRLKGGGKGKYKKAKHIGFLHYYTVQKFEEYKEELKEKNIQFNDDTPLFVSYKSTMKGSKKGDKLTNIFTIFIDASDKAFKGEKKFSPHDLRDVLSTVLMNPKVKANINLTKPLTSHVPTGIEAVYENPEDNEDKPNNDLLEVFKSCIPFLVPETLPELKAELNQQKQENQATQKQVTDLKQKLDENTKMLQEVRVREKALVERSEIPDSLLTNPVFIEKLQDILKDITEEKHRKGKQEANQSEEKSKEAILREQKETS